MWRGIIQRIVGPNRARVTRAASSKLAHDLGLPTDAVTGILERTAADLSTLSAADADIDARPILDRAGRELDQLGPRPLDEAIMDRYLHELPDLDYEILRQFKQGKQHSAIAELMGTDVDSVRRSLVRTYSGLRLAMLESTKPPPKRITA